jgi:hypothetical protein
MTDLRRAAEMALEFVEWFCGDDHSNRPKNKALDVRGALRQALAQPVDAVNISQERVDETAKHEHEPWCDSVTKLLLSMPPQIPPCNCKPKREWVGLTDEEIIKCFDSVAFGQVEDDLIINKHVNIFRAIHGIEAKLKEKNT